MLGVVQRAGEYCQQAENRLASKLCGSSQECLPGALAPFVYALQALDACSPYRWVTLKAFLSWRWPYQRAGHLAVWLCESTLRVIFVFRPKRHHGRRWKTGPSSPLLAKGLGPLLVGSLRQAVSPGIFRHEAPSPLPLGPVTQSHAMFWGFGLWHRSPASWEEAPGEIPQVYMLDMKPASLIVDVSNYCSGSRSSGSGRSSYASSSRPTSNGSQRPNYWRCCKCSGGWYSYQINDSCPMCQAWRCPNCEYSMS